MNSILIHCFPGVYAQNFGRHHIYHFLSESAAVPLTRCFGHMHFRSTLLSISGEFLLYYAVLGQIRLQSEILSNLCLPALGLRSTEIPAHRITSIVSKNVAWVSAGQRRRLVAAWHAALPPPGCPPALQRAAPLLAVRDTAAARYVLLNCTCLCVFQ
jgi:hypothetical protein